MLDHKKDAGTHFRRPGFQLDTSTAAWRQAAEKVVRRSQENAATLALKCGATQKPPAKKQRQNRVPAGWGYR
jgi:hypothetical protein